MTTQAVVEPAEWQPGDELYSRAAHPYSLYVFNYRDDSEAAHCTCPDAASWPEPRSHHLLPEDPLKEFIDECRGAD